MNKVFFSLNYEQLTLTAEKEIKKCDLKWSNPSYLLELNKAVSILGFWHLLAIVGHTDISVDKYVESDWLRLNALLYKKDG